MTNIGTKSQKWLSSAAVFCMTLGVTAGAAQAADPGLDALLDQLLHSKESTTYSRLATIQVPGKPLAVFDISFVDSKRGLYYLADRSNAALDVVDTRTNTVVAQIGGFVGVQNDPATGKPSFDFSGPDGVQAVGANEVWVGDGDSTVKVIDIDTQTTLATISTALDGQTPDQAKRADEMAYDPRDQILVVANNAATPPFITLISTRPDDRRVLGHVVFKDSMGVEASVYDPANGLFYVNLTQLGADPNVGAVSIVDPRQSKEIGRFPITGCNSAGLVLGPRQQLLVGCSLTNNSQVISARDGTLLAEIPQVSGSDEIWYNPGDGNYYLAARGNPTAAGGPSLGVIDAFTNKFVTNVPTDISAHSVAVDAKTNHIFVPFSPVASDPACTAGCIAVYGGQEQESTAERDLETFVADLVR